MSPHEREHFRTSLLLVMDANRSRYGLGIPALSIMVQQYGLSPTTDETKSEVHYLVDKELVVAVEKTISPENNTWRITAAGRDYLATQNLA